MWYLFGLEANFDKINLVGAKGMALINCIYMYKCPLLYLRARSSGVVTSN